MAEQYPSFAQLSSLASPISTASVPELKDILRNIHSSSTVGKETFASFLRSLKLDGRNHVPPLNQVIYKICEMLEEARHIAGEALADNEEEILYGQRLLDDTEEPGYESTRSSSLERLVSKKRNFKWKENTVPRSEFKRSKPALNEHALVFRQKPGSEIDTNRSLEVKPPPMSQEKKTVDELFTANAARRSKEEQEEVARVKAIHEWLHPARCGRCCGDYSVAENTGGVMCPSSRQPLPNTATITFTSH